MKVTIDQSSLSAGLSKVQSAVTSRSTLPVLSNIHLCAQDGVLTLTATDLEVSITTKVEAHIEREGSTTIGAKKLVQIVRQLPNDAVCIDVDDTHLATLTCSQSRFKILGLEDSTFPKLTPIEDARHLTFPSIKLRKMLDKIAYAVCQDETRKNLNGILLSIKEGTLTTVATDGRRLALMETITDQGPETDGESILPTKAITELHKILPDEGECTITLGESEALFQTTETNLRTQLVEGSFPNFRQVIPTNINSEITIPREEFAQALSRVSLILNDSSLAVKINLESDSITLNAASGADESSEKIAASYAGESMAISFNPQYLADPLKNLESNTITIRFNDHISPIGMYADEGFLYVIMPMRN